MQLLSILLLFVPLVFQYKFGNKELFKSKVNDRWIQEFTGVCMVSLILQFGVTIFSFILSVRSMSSAGNRCATGAVGIFFISFVITVFMFLLIILQYSRGKRFINQQKQSV
jgi:succinate dehydrogenase hydrophobic anchor subunit